MPPRQSHDLDSMIDFIDPTAALHHHHHPHHHVVGVPPAMPPRAPIAASASTTSTGSVGRFMSGGSQQPHHHHENGNNGERVHPQVVSALRPFTRKSTLSKYAARSNRMKTLTIGSAGSRCLWLDRTSIAHIGYVLNRCADHDTHPAASQYNGVTVAHLRLVNVTIQSDAIETMIQLLRDNTSLTTVTIWSSGNSDSDETLLNCLAAGLAVTSPQQQPRRNNDTVNRIKFCHFNFSSQNASGSLLQALGHLLQCKHTLRSLEFEECVFDHHDPTQAPNHRTTSSAFASTFSFYQGLARQLELQSFAMQFCRFSDKTMAHMLNQLTPYNGSPNTATRTDAVPPRNPDKRGSAMTMPPRSSSLRSLSINQCSVFGQESFQALNQLMIAQQRLGLEELNINVALIGDDNNTGDWQGQWRKDFVNILLVHNYSLERLHIAANFTQPTPNIAPADTAAAPAEPNQEAAPVPPPEAPQQPPPPPQDLEHHKHDLMQWHEQMKVLVRRNRAIGAVRKSFLLAHDDSRQVQDPHPQENDHYDLALYSQALVKLFTIAPKASTPSSSSSTATPPSTTAEHCPTAAPAVKNNQVGASAGYLAVCSILPQLAEHFKN